MGIPAYFSHIVKKHSNILKKIKKLDIINNLLIDSNSVIYDAVRIIKYENDDDKFEESLINAICEKLEEYINIIKPISMVYIAFDGVAPVAKLEQQRNRRYKTWFQKQITYELENTPINDQWDTTAITPGSNFMTKLSTKINSYFNNPSKFNIETIIISTSKEPGEGEHKLFEYIRLNQDLFNKQKSIVYGLDADLIMLTINHLPITDQLYLFRETPHFISNIDKSLDPNSLYMLDIPLLAKAIILKLNNDKSPTMKQQKNRLYDYIFMTFLLGNDFIPHFPALNIRTFGIDHIMDTYKATLGKTNKNITDGKKIYWNNFRILIDELQKQEQSFVEMEYNRRDNLSKRWFSNVNAKDRDNKFQSIPLIDRKTEMYINPFEDFWQERYYKMLFDIDPTENNIKKVCINFLEALEWTFKYYSHECPDWRWKYNYHYPPLLQDLIRYIPYFDTNFVTIKEKNPVIELVQLAYVLPKSSLHLLPEMLSKELLVKHSDWYGDNCRFKWSFCKYFWESHVDLPIIDITQLENIVNSQTI